MKRLFRIRRRAAVRGEMREEVEAHVTLAAESLIRQGVPAAAAWQHARERFGDFESAMKTLYQSAENREDSMRRREWWDAIRQDLTISARQMRRSPLLAAAITITLALGIGANLVVFGVANRLLFSAPTGVVNADELRLLELPQGGPNPRSVVTNWATFVELRTATSFSTIGAFGFRQSKSLGRGTRAEHVWAAGATASFFPTVGVRPVIGRFFSEAEDTPPKGSLVAVISNELWKRRFGSSTTALGATLEIDEKHYRVVGVLPAHFTSFDLQPVDVWLPMADQSFDMSPDYRSDRGSKWLRIVGRLKHGVSDDRAAAEVSRIFALGNAEWMAAAARRAGVDPSGTEAGFTTATLNSVMPAKNGGTEADAAKVSIWLIGVAAVVLLIACANVATLLLTRAMRRTPEMAVRLALGVSRTRLVAQLLIESLLFAFAGAAIAVGAAYVSRGVIQSVILPDTDLGPALSLPVMGLGVFAVALICVLTSIAPALQVQRVELSVALKGASSAHTEGRKRLRAGLLIAQVAMSAILLVGAGLFVRSLENAKGKRLGIDMDRVLIAQVGVSTVGYSLEQQREYWNEAARRIRQVPGIENVGMTVGIPLQFSLGGSFILPRGGSLPKLSTGGPYRNAVDENFFQTLGARIIRGRGIGEGDVATAPRVVVINETLAKGAAVVGDPLGQCIRIWRIDSIPCATVVGVVEDITRHGVKEDPSYQYYIPERQMPGPHSLAMVVRTRPGRVSDRSRRSPGRCNRSPPMCPSLASGPSSRCTRRS